METDEAELPEWSAAMPRPTLAAVDRGILFHAILQHLDFEAANFSAEAIRSQAERMARQGWVEAAHLKQADLEPLARFLHSAQGQWLIAHRQSLRREIPFCMAVPAAWVERLAGEGEERVVVQGMIDALIEAPEGVWVVDFKTDAVSGEALQRRAEEYTAQMALYAQAVQRILRQPLAGALLVFLTAGESVVMPPETLRQWQPTE